MNPLSQENPAVDPAVASGESAPPGTVASSQQPPLDLDELPPLREGAESGGGTPPRPVASIRVPPPDLDELPSTRQSTASSSTAPSIAERPYDPGPQRELARMGFGGCLLLILALVSVLPFVALEFSWAATAELQTLLQIIFGPLVTLVGTVAGFYFGSQAVQAGSESAPGAGNTTGRSSPP